MKVSELFYVLGGEIKFIIETFNGKIIDEGIVDNTEIDLKNYCDKKIFHITAFNNTIIIILY